MKIKDYTSLYFIVFLVATGWLTYKMFSVYTNAIILAAIIAGAFTPMQKKMIRKFKLSQNIVSWLMVIIIMTGIIIPVIYIFTTIGLRIANLLITLHGYEIDRFFSSIFEQRDRVYIPKKIQEILHISGDLDLSFVSRSVQEVSKELGNKVLSYSNTILKDTLDFIVQMFVFAVALFAFFNKGRKIKQFCISLLPLSKKNAAELVSQIDQLNYLTIVGNGLGGIIQGGLAGIIFFISGADDVILWTLVMSILAFIPLVGISIVSIPYGLIMIFIQGQYFRGLFIIGTCALIAFVVENISKPKFIGNRMKYNPVLLLFGIMGGMSLFGVLGIFYGPFLILIFLFLLKISRKTFTGYDSKTKLSELANM